jgi:acyl-coenzyme A synthetase/AMP-(fatty) acid ligase
MDLASFNSPMDCGRRLIPQLVDEIAFTDPERVFASVPKSSNLDDGYQDVSYNAFARAVNRCAWFLEKELGRSQDQTTLFYIGPLDLRYLVIILGAVKTGHLVYYTPSTFYIKRY